MTAGVGTKGLIVVTEFDFAMAVLTVGVVFLCELIMAEHKVLDTVAVGAGNVRQVLQLAMDSIAGSYYRNTVTRRTTYRYQLAFLGLVAPAVTTKTTWRIAMAGVVRE